MGRLFRPFRRLQWKLTLTYTLFAAVAILLLQAISLLALQTFLPRANAFSKTILTRNLSKSASQAAPFLARIPPDRPALADWLRRNAQLRGMRVVMRGPRGPAPGAAGSFKAIVDPDGELMAAAPPVTEPADFLLSIRRHPEAESVLKAALSGQRDPDMLAARIPDGSLVAAVPILGKDDAILGALISTFPASPSTGGLLLTILNWRNVVFITFVAGLVGALFGFLTARWLTRRLHHMALATDAWGRGDFSVRVPNRSGDELGRLAEQMNAMAGQLRDLLSTREKLAVLEERNRLARDLHDSVTQALYSVTLYAEASSRQLSAGDGGAARNHLEDLRATAQQALLEMRLLLHELRPPELDKEGLVAVIQARLDEVELRAGLKAELKVEGVPRLSAEAEEGLYRIAQEALNNALKHARPRRITVRLRAEGGAAIMEITDDGVGFDCGAGAPHGGLGLRGMEERAARLGGTFSVTSGPGQGTTVRVEVRA